MTFLDQIASAGTINIPLIIVLLAIGAVCKHCFKKLNNDTIPVIMLIAGVVIVILLKIPFDPRDDVLLNVLVEGIASGATAVGIHTQGKTIFTIFGVFGSDKNNVESDTNSDSGV